MLQSRNIASRIMSNLRLALVQLAVGTEKAENVRKAISFIEKAKKKEADIVTLPECFNSPYGTSHFPKYAETIPNGDTCNALSEAAKKNAIYVIGGTIPERDGDKLYNTATVWDPQGKLIAKYRKIHLFDIDVKGKVTFRESDTLSPGNSLATFEVKECKIGIGICYDIRFEELARLYRKEGCQMLIYPGAFNLTTGPLHWSLLQRSRANDNQLYVACVSPARGTGDGYIAYGHTQLTNPWGSILRELEEKEDMIVEDIDLRLALVQLAVGTEKAENVRRAISFIEEAKKKGADIVTLPECFNSPYGTSHFPNYAETIPNGDTCNALSEAAKKNAIYVIGGTIPERDGDKLYNTATVWDPQGKLIAKYRKIHLFDINVKGKVTFRESDALSPGNSLATFEVKGCKIGIGICYDIRFEELARLYRKQGCQMLIYPGAFNVATGHLHWSLLQRSRATDNQLYVASVSPARGTGDGYIAYGHTQLTNPWGTILRELGEKEDMIVEDIDLSVIDEVRSQIPVFHQRRTDLYDTIWKKS